MIPSHDQLASLRAALQASPENVPLRQLIGQTLLSMGNADEAEHEFKAAIALATHSPKCLPALHLGLAHCYYQQSKDSQALTALEAVLKADPENAEALTLNAKVLLRSGQSRQAVEQFRLALMQDASLKDSELADSLSVVAADAEESNEGSFEERPADKGHPAERAKITFTEVGGMDALKEEIRLKIIYPITHADMYKAYGKSIGGGILMYGPPGCGKTHLARATAGEIRADFMAISISDILDMYLGSSEQNLHDVFEQARQNAPCVLFFDEVDALASRRSDALRSGGRHVINQFLTELDGVQHSNEGLLILAATNAPWYVDSAFRRPGRFDRILFVQPPDAEARTAILRLLCKGKPIEDIDFEMLGRKTDRCSGADLQAVVDRAVEKKLQAAMKTGIPQPLTTKDLLRAAKSVSPSTKEWFGTARNYANHANQDGTYDDILTYLKQR
ncbi:MAG: AAA family ATPase [Phormidesmis sp.]